MFTGWMYDMIVGYVGLGMRIEMRLCTIMRVIIISFYEYKPSHFARFATLSCHPNHPCTSTAFYLTTTLRRRLSPVSGFSSNQQPCYLEFSRKGNTQKTKLACYIHRSMLQYTSNTHKCTKDYCIIHKAWRTGSNFPRGSRIYWLAGGLWRRRGSEE